MKADHLIESKNKETNQNSRFENYNNCNRNSLEGFNSRLMLTGRRISESEDAQPTKGNLRNRERKNKE